MKQAVRMRLTLRCLTIALALGCATSSALAQLRVTARRTLTANPPKATLGTPITLSVRGAAQNAIYRYVAQMTVAGIGTGSGHTTNCSASKDLGSGPSVTWLPASGNFTLTAYGPRGNETDTLRLSYVVGARRVMLASAQLPGPGDSLRLMLRTDDLGPGHSYEWSMRYRMPTGAAQGQAVQWSTPWSATTTSPMATYPKPLPRPPQTIQATVGIHRGNPCEIIAAGAMGFPQ